MSDRYVQLDLLQIADVVPAVDSDNNSKILIALPNYAVGDRVKVLKKMRSPKFVGHTGTVVRICPHFGVNVDFDVLGKYFVDQKYLEKVRVHCPSQQDCRTAADTPVSPAAPL